MRPRYAQPTRTESTGTQTSFTFLHVGDILAKFERKDQQRSATNTAPCATVIQGLVVHLCVYDGIYTHAGLHKGWKRSCTTIHL